MEKFNFKCLIYHLIIKIKHQIKHQIGLIELLKLGQMRKLLFGSFEIVQQRFFALLSTNTGKQRRNARTDLSEIEKYTW